MMTCLLLVLLVVLRPAYPKFRQDAEQVAEPPRFKIKALGFRGLGV